MSTAVHEIVGLPGWGTANTELDKRFLTAISNKDIDGVMRCFANIPELVVVVWGREMRGPAEVRRGILDMFSNFDEVKLEIDRVSEFASGDGVIAVGQATYTLKKAGQVSKIKEIWTDLRRNIDGRWVYVLDHAEIIP